MSCFKNVNSTLNNVNSSLTKLQDECFKKITNKFKNEGQELVDKLYNIDDSNNDHYDLVINYLIKMIESIC